LYRFQKPNKKTPKFRQRPREIFLAKSINKLVARAQLYEFLDRFAPPKIATGVGMAEQPAKLIFLGHWHRIFLTGCGYYKTTYHLQYNTKNTRGKKEQKINKNTINNYSTNEPGKLSGTSATSL